MGRYIQAIQNLTIQPYSFNSSLIQNNSVDPAITNAVDMTNGWLGLGVIIPVWFGLFQYVSDRANSFELSPLQALVSVNAMIFTLVIALVYVGIFSVAQHFIIITTLMFLVNIVGIIRTA